MDKTWKKAALFAGLAVAGCSGREAAANPDDGGAWMEGAIVMVESNAGTGRETVTLRDQASGFQQQMNDEPVGLEALEADDSPAVVEALNAAGISD